MDATEFVKEGQFTQTAAELSEVMNQIQKENPVLAKHLFHVRTGEGLPNLPGGHSEVYPAWQRENPAPGLHTIAVFDKNLKPQALKNLLKGESFHILGSMDPRTGQPVDPTWMALKQQFLNSLTPEQINIDVKDFKNLQQQGITYDSLAHYYSMNRIDAYFRGALSPMTEAEREDWGHTYTPEQKQILGQAQKYLSGGQ